MGVMEEILAELQGIRAVLASGAGPATETPKPGRKPKAEAPKGPTLEDCQNLIRELVAADDAEKTNAKAIKAACVALGGTRAGDFEGDAAKLQQLHDNLVAIKEGGAAEEDDGDLL